MPSQPDSSAYTAFPLMRAVGPPDVPFDGVLARAPGGGMAYLVDRDLLRDWPAWRLPPDAHVLAPADIVRRRDGHDVVLPVLADRLDRLLSRRGGSSVPLADGEALTIAVSVLRGMQTAHVEDLDDETASWWVTAEGMPVLVYASGDVSAVRASAEIVATLAKEASHEGFAEVLAQLAGAVTEPRALVRDIERWEDALFGGAQPEPLATDIVGARRGGVRAQSPDPLPAEHEAPRRPWWGLLAFSSDAVLSDAASDLVHRTRTQLARRASGRARPALLAAGLAVIVLVVGLSWPDGAEPSPAVGAEVREPSPTPSESAAAEMGKPGSEPATDLQAEDPATALLRVLDARAACDDPTCRGAAQEDAAQSLPAGAVDAPARTVTLLDDFGGLAVLRVDAPDVRSQLVTIVATPAGWRIRDVFDVADPPA
ncbi:MULTISPECIES: hypothetical protein [Microbacterium]|uniref:Uncharacterized protein n=1 Tax=Microbacterium wangchenii TaxID=2541726 RepID=A0ABX5SUM3_9MICO|nr:MULTISPECIES: hypothetical protein [Microbacterium]MCK6065389.1 hypothetical protein [Microbacterium sp. EYE_512]QBR88828.1 hypothetical protein E4K62_09070 [Microbacterium wangchenii]TXK20553.1 hypothetical protein FVP99_02695 [Microbacterium wangchenii]